MNKGMRMEIDAATTTRAGAPAKRGMGGFTLIELMVVVAVIAILASIAYPSYQEQIRKSRRAQAKADLVELTQVLERFRTVNNTYEDADDDAAGFFAASPRNGSQHYALTLEDDGASTYTLVATPTSDSQSNDRCGILTIDQAGVKTNSQGVYANCW